MSLSIGFYQAKFFKSAIDSLAWLALMEGLSFLPVLVIILEIYYSKERPDGAVIPFLVIRICFLVKQLVGRLVELDDLVEINSFSSVPLAWL